MPWLIARLQNTATIPASRSRAASAIIAVVFPTCRAACTAKYCYRSTIGRRSGRRPSGRSMSCSAAMQGPVVLK
jgi:phosphosulfolactate phosphohydrolase-like enzyme